MLLSKIDENNNNTGEIQFINIIHIGYANQAKRTPDGLIRLEKTGQ